MLRTLLLTLLYILCDFLVIANSTQLLVREFRNFDVNRMITCVFCMDYDNLGYITVSGCTTAKVTCQGNACFMRQHKNNKYFLYTAGCLNITNNEYDQMAKIQNEKMAIAGDTGTETLLCEVAKKANTCICTTENNCNNITVNAPFSEYHTQELFDNMKFYEYQHFRYFTPHEPALQGWDLDGLNHLRHHFPAYKSFSLASSNFSIFIFLFSILIVLC